MSRDYKNTVFLPKTEFPMRAGLPTREPILLARWQAMDLYQRLRTQSAGRTKFILHDGPPYANGNIHLGHAVNKILKDVINRSWQMLGYDAPYVPGWDCHGLPIEWKIEEKYRTQGLDKDEVPIDRFRGECRSFAQHWVGVQSEEFQRLGVVGDWTMPYTTMDFAAEADIVREIHKFLRKGSLYRGAKPVLWSVVEKTALAEAELEYHDHTSTTVWIRFPLVRASDPALDGAAALIWTTTPWTLPGNRAIAYGDDIAYGVYEVEATGEGSLAVHGERLVLAVDLANSVAEAAKIGSWKLTATLPGRALAGSVACHPLKDHGYGFPVPLLSGDFVTTEVGTGLVHIAPGHGEDDYVLCRKNGIAVPDTVAEDGRYFDQVPLFAGRATYTTDGKPGDADPAVVEAMRDHGGLLAQSRLRHSYPHSWRSKAPLIFRNTPQWFISMEHGDLRDVALRAIAETVWVPPQGRNRLEPMIENRPDWCISRQRAWGVPIAIFVNKADGQPLDDPAVLDRIATIFAEEGADAWFVRDPQDFLGNQHRAEDYEQVRDIVDVWFESGSTHAFVLERRSDLAWPASLYLEGTDQHRGWFHSSLLESCATRGRAPYDAVLTHGFTLDEQGRKMSKSLNNGVEPQEVNDKYGADILRLWVIGADYSEDMRLGPDILKHQVDLYRRLRNTLRYLLGALHAFDPAERVNDPAAMPELERWVLHRLYQLDRLVRRDIARHEYNEPFLALHGFCSSDLSAFYFDVRKDSLYCDLPTAPRRRAVRTVMEHLLSCLTAWLAPVLCFTAEEAWLARPGGGMDGDSVHLRIFPEVPELWRDEALGVRWERIRAVRRVVTGALELARADKTIGSSLQAAPVVHMDADTAALVQSVDFADVCITSAITTQVGPVPDGAFVLNDLPGIGVTTRLAEGGKCERCWKVLPEVGTVPSHPAACRRCADAVDGLEVAA